jgi:glycosyltransferase involved in cell wall biosynthesis
MTRVSVIIPTYNHAESLPQTVGSILQQTHSPLEVIIVDDGSMDDTETVCAGMPGPVRYMRQQNAGVSAARNHGIAEARGEWVALADSDDLWHPSKLEVQLAALARATDARWCATGCQVIGPDSAPVPGRQGFERVFAVFDSATEPPESFFSRWLSRDEIRSHGQSHAFFHGDFFELLFHGNVVLPSSALIHKGVFDRVGRFDEAFRLAEETEFFHRAAAREPGVIIMTPLVGYRVAQTGSLTNPANTPRLVNAALTSLDRAAELRGKLTASECAAYRRGRQRLLADLAYAELSLLHRQAARTALLSAWQAGVRKDARTVAVYAASLLPTPVLRRLHWLKRRVAPRKA